MQQPLSKVTIKGFKSIRSLENFPLQHLNVLIGGNGAGKSNFIEFFRMLVAMMRQDGLKQFVAGSADAYLFGGPKTTQAIEVRLKFDYDGYDFQLSPTEDGFFLINRERQYRHPADATNEPSPLKRDISTDSGNFNPMLLQDHHTPGMHTRHGASRCAYETIRSWGIYHFHDTGPLAGMRRYQPQSHNERLFTDAANIAPYLLALRESHPFDYDDILSAVRLVIPFFDDFILQPNAQETLRLDWRQKGLADYPMRPSQLSDGAIRFICLAAALLQPEPPATLIIDEPEIGLHPQAIAILAELLQSAAKQTQVIIATQSPGLINYFAVEDIIVVNRKDGQSTFERLKEKDFSVWLEEYSIGELWAKNVIAGGPAYE